MRRGSLFFVWEVIFCLFLGLFVLPQRVSAVGHNQITVGATVLEHITYQKVENTLVISTNIPFGVTIYTKNAQFSGKIIKIPIDNFDISGTPFFITANY